MAPANVDAAVRYQLGELAAEMRTLRDTMRRIQERADRAEDKAAESRADRVDVWMSLSVASFI